MSNKKESWGSFFEKISVIFNFGALQREKSVIRCRQIKNSCTRERQFSCASASVVETLTKPADRLISAVTLTGILYPFNL